MRLLVALFVAPILGALLGAAVGALLGVLDAAHLQVSPTSLFMAQFTHWLPWIALTTCLSTLVLGLPLHVALQRNRSFGLGAYWIGGLVLGIIIVLIGALATLGDIRALYDALSDAVPYMLVASATGAATGFFAWLIRRPDRDANPTTPAP
jgi:hypothetical protein